jgi:hypothetical protein
MAAHGTTDTDMGLADILKEMEKLKTMCVKVGITKDAGEKTADSGATLAQIASWNELGVLRKPGKQKKGGKWFIPPRPFVRGWADGKREQIAKTLEKVGKLVSEGKHDAYTAIRRIGEYSQGGIKAYIKNGTFTPNSDVTIHGSKPDKNGKQFIKPKKSTKPLIDTGTMRNSIRYQVIEKPVDMVSEK